MPSSASPPPQTSPLSLHDALPIFVHEQGQLTDPILDLVHLHRHPRRRCNERAAWSGQAGPAEMNGAAGRRHQCSHDGDRPGLLVGRSEEHTSELQSLRHLVCRLLLLLPPRPPLFPYTTLFRSSYMSRVSSPIRSSISSTSIAIPGGGATSEPPGAGRRARPR